VIQLSFQAEKKMNSIKRRTFLGYSAASLAAAPLLMTGARWAFAGAAESGTWPHLREAIVINNLGFINDPNQPADPMQGRTSASSVSPRALRDAVASGMTAVNATIGYTAGPMDPFEHSVREIAIWNQLIQSHPDQLLKVWSTEDIRRAKREGKVGIIMGFQNAAMMGEDATRVDIFAGLGVKIIQLTYNPRNQLGDGSIEKENRGLTAFGHEVVERLNAARTLVDLSHSGEQTCLDAIRASKDPIAITHTGCRALSDVPRNKTDEELRLLADKGGMVGIYFMPFLKEDSFPDAMDVVRHIEHAVQICGEDHVGIGTDGTTTQVDDLEGYRAVINKEVEQRQKAGISAPGEKPGVVPFIPDLQGPGQFQKLADLLHQRGHSSGRIEKILGQNFLRLMGDVWAG